MKNLLLTLVFCLFSANSFATTVPLDTKKDSRVKVFTYSEGDVYKVAAHYGVSTYIRFSEEEEIKHISLGDSISWELAPINNGLFIKPIEKRADTNMTIITNRFIYNFELTAKTRSIKDKHQTFFVKFRYPQDVLIAAMAAAKAKEAQQKEEEAYQAEEISSDHKTSPEDWNLNYSKKGDEDIAPIHVFDDGTFTYFQFPEKLSVPAIFMVDSEQQESLINFHQKGKYIVVQRIGQQFMLRSGNKATCIYNEAFAARIEPSKLKEKEEQSKRKHKQKGI